MPNPVGTGPVGLAVPATKSPNGHCAARRQPAEDSTGEDDPCHACTSLYIGDRVDVAAAQCRIEHKAIGARPTGEAITSQSLQRVGVMPPPFKRIRTCTNKEEVRGVVGGGGACPPFIEPLVVEFQPQRTFCPSALATFGVDVPCTLGALARVDVCRFHPASCRCELFLVPHPPRGGMIVGRNRRNRFVDELRFDALPLCLTRDSGHKPLANTFIGRTAKTAVVLIL
jgi:hypothetical protein